MKESNWLTHGAPKKPDQPHERKLNALKPCGSCLEMMPPENGIEANGGAKWICYKCWRRKLGLAK